MRDNQNNNILSQKPCVHVYIRKMPFDVASKDIFPVERLVEIDDAGNGKVRTQKYYAWKLLELAMSEVFGLDMSDSGISKADGIWCCNSCKFSISHSGEYLAVAISTHPVGIDIEEADMERFDAIRHKILHPKEESLCRDLCILWTCKESIFKKLNKKIFVPRKINTLEHNCYSRKLMFDDKNFVVSVATDLDEEIQFNIKV